MVTAVVSQKKLQDALALIIACTRRAPQGRPKDIVVVAEAIAYAKQQMGSLTRVGQTVGVSEQQLRDFLAVMRLDDDIRALVQKRVIDSVDVVKNLAKLSGESQRVLAESLRCGEINSQDIRVVTGFARTFPEKKMEKILSEYGHSRDVKIYVVRFHISDPVAANTVRSRVETVVGKKGISSLSVKGRVGELELTRAGYRRLREEVRRRRTTLRDFVESAVEASVGQQ